MMKIYPYNMGSASAKALADTLGVKRIKHEGKWLYLTGTVINWGASQLLPNRNWVYGDDLVILNNPRAVKKASNKLETFKALDGVCSIPEWTEDPLVARQWYADDVVVVARTKLNGHSGQGIVLSSDVNGEEEWEAINAHLYTKYIPKAQEYRLHVFQGEVFFTQRKARKKEVPDDQVNWKVRNHANGFIFAHNEGVDVGDGAKALAVLAVETLGLDFGAVDMIYNKKQDRYYVLEVNTACGLEGETLDRYVKVFEPFL